MDNLAIGVLAAQLLVADAYNIVIGDRSGSEVERMHCTILIGKGLNPGKELSYYINIRGTEYPNAVRRERWFQDMAWSAARIEVDSMTDTDVTRRRSEAMRAIDLMSFHEDECAAASVS